MSLVDAKCTICGSILQVDDSKDAAICPFCSSPFVVEKAINALAGIHNASGRDYSDAFVIRAGKLEKYVGMDIDVSVPSNVIVIGAGAFRDLSSLNSVTLPEGLLFIEEYAFSKCISLKNVTLPNTLSKIGDHAFEGCSSLEQIVLPEGLQKLGSDVFSGCNGLTTVVAKGDNFSWGNDPFSGVHNVSKFEASPALIERVLAYNFDVEDHDYWGHLGFLSDSIWYEPAKKQHIQERRRDEWKANFRCQHCGGKLVGFFTTRCASCGKEKDY